MGEFLEPLADDIDNKFYQQRLKIELSRKAVDLAQLEPKLLREAQDFFPGNIAMQAKHIFFRLNLLRVSEINEYFAEKYFPDNERGRMLYLKYGSQQLTDEEERELKMLFTQIGKPYLGPKPT